MKKRILPVFLALVMLLGMLPMSVFALDVADVVKAPLKDDAGDSVAPTDYAVTGTTNADGTNAISITATDLEMSTVGNDPGYYVGVGFAMEDADSSISYAKGFGEFDADKYDASSLETASAEKGDDDNYYAYVYFVSEDDKDDAAKTAWNDTDYGTGYIVVKDDSAAAGYIVYNVTFKVTVKDTSAGGNTSDESGVTVIPAPLTDGYTYTAVLSADNTITITAKDLEKSTAGGDAEAYYVGVGLSGQDTNATYAWGIGDIDGSATYGEPDDTTTIADTDGNDISYVLLYFSSADWSKDGTGYISVKVGDNDATNYTVNFAVQVKDTSAGGDDDDNNGDDTTTNLKFELLESDILADSEGLIFGKKPAELGDFKVDQDGLDITVTGSANYVEWAAFSNDTSEQAGHYLPIHIYTAADDAVVTGEKVTVKGGETKELAFGDDNSFELAMFLDKLTDGKFTVAYKDELYTVDCSKLVLLPKTASGVTPSTDEDDNVILTTDHADVTLPSDLENLGQMDVTIATAAANDITIKDDDAPEAVTTAIKSGTAIEVTIEIDGQKQFADGSDTLKTALTITIKGLNNNKEYCVFCVMDNGSVSYYGYATPKDSSIAFETKHLCHFVAVEKTEEVMTAIAAADMKAEDGSGLTGSAAAPGDSGEGGEGEGGESGFTKNGLTIKYTDRTALKGGDEYKYFGGKLTLTNNSGTEKTYLVSIGAPGTKVSNNSSKDLSITYVITIGNEQSESLACQNVFQVLVAEFNTKVDFSDTDTFTIPDKDVITDWVAVSTLK